MARSLAFDFPDNDYTQKAGLWLKVAALLTAGYMVFGLMLIGVPGLARGGAVVVLASVFWAVSGVLGGHFRFPKILWLPILFFLFMALSGFLLPAYPLTFLGQITTIWGGAICIALFVANGVSMRLIIAGLVLVMVSNMIAVLIGYDGFQVNFADEIDALPNAEIKRVSGLAGQTNLLVALMFSLPFFCFLLKKRLGFIVYLLCTGICITTMIMTASRSTLMFTPLFILFGAAFFIKSPTIRMLFATGGLAALVVGLNIVANPDFLNKLEKSKYGQLHIVERTINSIDNVETGETEERERLVTEFWQFYKDKPIIGYGPYKFIDVVGDGFYAHNNFAEIAIDWGTIGLVFYYSLYASILIGIMKSMPANLFILAPLAFVAVSDLVMVTFLERPLVLAVCLMLILTWTTKPVSKRRRRRRRR